MSKEDDYRRSAADTLDLAKRALTTADRARLIWLAEAWIDLAERAQQSAREPIRELQTLLRT